MAFVTRSVAVLAIASTAFAQTFSACNPLTETACPPAPALGQSEFVDFTQGSSYSFTAVGQPTYDGNGVSLTVAGQGDAPTLTSSWYIMFGRVDVAVKAAPGAGIVSSVVLQSDVLDEIDWEWLGAAPDEVQTNYFGKGQTTTWTRGAFHSDPGSQSQFKTYTIDWTPEQIVWQIDGVTVRVLSFEDAEGQFPQTPMQLKLGSWAGGDPSNAPGTIAWSRGPTDYSQGPFSMQVRSISVTDYSTGTQYVYGDKTGSWQSIVAVGGAVNSRSGGSIDMSGSATPSITQSASGAPLPFGSTSASGNGGSSTVSGSRPIPTTYPGLPSGWTVNSDGRVVPPSSASSSTRRTPFTIPLFFCLMATWPMSKATLTLIHL